MIEPKEPLVSIIMNCYQGERYLQIAIESVMAQTYQNWELIFWDNQSTDRSAEIIKNYDDKRFKYYYALKHTMLSEARNYAIEKSSGVYIAFLDVDDWWSSNKLKKQIPLFEDPNVYLVYGNFWIENERKRTRKVMHNKNLPTGHILNELLKNYVVGLLTIVIRRKAFDILKIPFKIKYHIIGDFDLVVRTAINWEIGCIQEPIAYFRLHQDNESVKKKELHVEEQEEWYNNMKEKQIFAELDGFKNKAIQITYFKGSVFAEHQKFIEAIKCFLDIPMSLNKWKLLIIILIPKYFLDMIRQ
jgi:glycosyltransferase involved in cell wall biosynthesis